MPDRISTKGLEVLSKRSGLGDTITPARIEETRKGVERDVLRGVKDTKQEINMVYRICDHALRLKAHIQEIKTAIAGKGPEEIVNLLRPPEDKEGALEDSLSFSGSWVKEVGEAEIAENPGAGARAGKGGLKPTGTGQAMAKVGSNLAAGKQATGAGSASTGEKSAHGAGKGPVVTAAEQDAGGKGAPPPYKPPDQPPWHEAGAIWKLLGSWSTERLNTV